jgi:hypothetical protein
VGVLKDDIQAYMWFILASTSGGADEIKTQDDVAATLTSHKSPKPKTLLGSGSKLTNGN